MSKLISSWNIYGWPRTGPLMGEVWHEHCTCEANCYQCDARTLWISLSNLIYFHFSTLTTSTHSNMRNFQLEQAKQKLKKNNKKINVTKTILKISWQSSHRVKSCEWKSNIDFLSISIKGVPMVVNFVAPLMNSIKQ